LEHLLPDQTHIGAVHLTVRDMDNAIAFYEKSLGFKTHSRENGIARLGGHAVADTPILVLHENPEAKPAYRATGLYHFAVLVPSRLELAQVLRRIAETRTPVQGFADHGVSEAIYLPDPEGNGIEVYRDRLRDEWPYHGETLAMVSDPLDLDGLTAELEGHAETWAGIAGGTTIGHMHLKVADIDKAEGFYVNLVGFDLIQHMRDSASFISAGGYHHHIGMNTWESRGAMPPPPDATGLRWFEVQMPDAKTVGAVADRVRKGGSSIEEAEEGLLVRDPFNIGVMLTTGS
jgi:catechol 2,3-dioxygenase